MGSDPAAAWHLLTGEYPPAPGGVSDYTRLVARGLAAAGDAVEVWAPTAPGPPADDSGVRVHRLPDNFGPRSLRLLDAGLRRRPGPRRLLVQYVPHAFGFKAMNVGLCHWLYRTRRRECVWVMFHEVCFPRGWGRPLRHNLLGTVQRWMARQAARAARRRFVATPYWDTLLRSIGHFPGPSEWLPVPSNVATAADPAAQAAIRAAVAPNGETVLGYFGTFPDHIAPLLSAILAELLRRDARCVALLLGRGGEEYAGRLRREHPDLAGRIVATGGLDAQPLADHLAACDLLLQPYPDGASGRRTSLMAGVALGLPAVSNRGRWTEPVWAESKAVALVNNDPSAWVAAAERLLADPTARAALGANACRLYQDRFAVERTIATLRARHFEDLRAGPAA
jgi:glycosyltransferase involved in cell wall biosynthesis